ncbi:hypothetical protein ARALYDRAFT_917556 [Arabidopsis lyrata subsp. lyrata]|uniref:Myb/SANT-like domain-containing protein n=1 Tax=Arabidopsis lyrata subsp. lyrata TaxID=81972 RepID=D7MTG1_ARALL|nr:hypothetical protein ARALYDRAFT_917556 [Arabidopsis lyrata subsp. lyrata]
MGNYRFKDPTPLGREFIVDKFNKEFNLNINYRFFKEKLDQLKRKYKKYKHLMKDSTGISVDTTTSVISASNSWWKEREVCKIVKSFKRKPPELWDVMQRCFILYDVHSQPQFSVNQRREQLRNDGLDNDEGHVYFETYDGDMQDSQVPEPQENEEVYRVNIDDETRQSNAFIRESLHQNSSPVAPFQIPTSRIQQRGGVRRGSSSQRGAGNSQISTRSGSRGSRRKQSFETTLTDTITGFREFQRQSLQQLRPKLIKAFRICQLRSQGVHNLNYEERIELWNLENEQFEELIIQPSLSYYNRNFERGPIQTDGGLGWRNIWRRIQEDSAACLQLLRMSLDCFRSLCDVMEIRYGLQPTLNVSIEKSVAMFLRICGHNEVQRDVGLRFGRTQETVNRKFFEVLRATELLACDYIKTPTRQELRRIPKKLQRDRRYWPYFSGFVGAIDGVHVCVKVKPELQGMYWNRHDRTSFNIMAICDINMLFTYVWNGAPGSCHDTAVLTMAQDLLPPRDKYYVVDSGYPNKQGFLAPYRSSISNYFDEDFVEVMGDTNINNVNSENDLDDMERGSIPDGNHMANIRENIADMLWANQNTFH